MAPDEHDEKAALRADPAKRLRDLLTPRDQAHVKLMERLKALYVETERDERLAAEMQRMIENATQRRDPSRPYGIGNRREGMALGIIAESGAGKSRAMLHYLKDNPYFPNYGVPRSGCQLITVGAKAPCLLRTLGMETLRGAAYHAQRELPETEAWSLARFQIQHQIILFVHFEELQRVIQQKNRNERKKIVETLAGLLTDETWPWHLILSGLPAMRALFEEADVNLDDHDTLRRRTRFVEFSPIDPKGDSKVLDSALKQYEKIAGVSLEVARQPEMRARHCHAAARQLGLFFELTVLALDACLRARRKKVTRQDFEAAYAARTLAPYDLNPFFSPQWETIDTSVIQNTQPETESKPSRRKGERRRFKDDE